jgi:hypothetical protein
MTVSLRKQHAFRRLTSVPQVTASELFRLSERVVVRPGEVLVVNSGIRHLFVSLGPSIMLSRAKTFSGWESLAIKQPLSLSGHLAKEWSTLARCMRLYCGIPVRGMEVIKVGQADGEKHDDINPSYHLTMDFSEFWVDTRGDVEPVEQLEEDTTLSSGYLPTM